MRGLFLALFFCLSIGSLVWAFPVQMDYVYWEMTVSYGSGTQIGNGQLNSKTDQNLPPNDPETLPYTEDVEIEDDSGIPYFYSYASFSADNNYLDVYVEGFADDYDFSHLDWFSSFSKVAIGTDLFYGSPVLNVSFDWNVIFDFNQFYNNGYAKIGVGLIDWTERPDRNNPYFVYREIFDYADNESGHYSQTWTNLDPTHQYILGVGALAFLTGAEDVGGSIDVEISDLSVNAVPEPKTLLLFSISLIGLFFYMRSTFKKKPNH